MTGGGISQADRSRWQQQAAAELVVILAAHPGIPVIAWTVTASGGVLSGQVLAPAAGRRGLFAEWRQELGLDEVTQTPSATGAAVYLVRAENCIHGSDQQSCSPSGRPVMITDHVPAVRVPPDHAGRRVAATGPA